MTHIVDEKCLAVSCDGCGASPGQWCRTSGGDRARYLHARRTRLWDEGHQAGMEFMALVVSDYLEKGTYGSLDLLLSAFVPEAQEVKA